MVLSVRYQSGAFLLVCWSFARFHDVLVWHVPAFTLCTSRQLGADLGPALASLLVCARLEAARWSERRKPEAAFRCRRHCGTIAASAPTELGCARSQPARSDNAPWPGIRQYAAACPGRRDYAVAAAAVFARDALAVFGVPLVAVASAVAIGALVSADGDFAFAERGLVVLAAAGLAFALDALVASAGSAAAAVDGAAAALRGRPARFKGSTAGAAVSGGLAALTGFAST